VTSVARLGCWRPRVGRDARVGDGIGQRPDQRDERDDGSGPPVRHEQRHCARLRRSGVQDVHVDPDQLGREMPDLAQPRVAAAPVIGPRANSGHKARTSPGLALGDVSVAVSRPGPIVAISILCRKARWADETKSVAGMCRRARLVSLRPAWLWPVTRTVAPSAAAPRPCVWRGRNRRRRRAASRRSEPGNPPGHRETRKRNPATAR
jgi:hypothetical protein